MIIGECGGTKTFVDIAKDHPETTSEAIRKRYKRFKEGDSSALIFSRGAANRIFSAAEEKVLADRLRKLRREGIPLSENFVRHLAIEYFDELHGAIQTRRNHREFSHGFLMGFKRRQGFSTQKLAKKETVKTFSVDELLGEAMGFILAVDSAIEKFGRRWVFNMDETPAPFLESPTHTWGDKGKGEKYVANTLKRMKGNVTLLPTISAAGIKLPLAWINDGKTRRAINKMSLPNGVVSFNSPKGWTNESAMIAYLNEVILKHTKGRRCALILDDYAAHWTNNVQNAAAQGNIELIKVPKGLTSILQPLDVSFNSSFKDMRELQCCIEMCRHSGDIEDKENIIRRAAISYHKVHKSVVLKGWEACTIGK